MTSPQIAAQVASAEVDPRPRRLLERYTSLVGGMVMEVGPDLLDVELPAAELARLGRRAPLRVALSPAALDEDPEAEILLVGSGLLSDLIGAIRERGAYDQRGALAPSVDPTPEAATLGIPLEGAVVDAAPATELVELPVGRLFARVSIRSGPSLTERLVESSIVDLTVGTPIAPAVAAACERFGAPGAPSQASGDEPRAVPARPMAELLPVLFADLERQLEAELMRIRDDASRACAAELGRLDAYYGRMLDEVDPDEDPDAVLARKAAIRADHARRRAEAEYRFQVHVTAHPIQLIGWRVPAQRATWALRSDSGAAGQLSATRTLVGDTAWQLSCPACGGSPAVLRVCHHGHVACGTCSDRCGVCGEGACRSHGARTCEVEGHAACDRHVATCDSCGRAHCTTHASHCAARDHEVCATCAVHCAHCGMELCRAHAIQSGEDAPRGARLLCKACTVYCEGGTNEPVGVDEVERCTSCERSICHAHAATCAVDGHRHCSRHLRRSDQSGRLVCEAHRAACADEPDAILARDEVAACASCERAVCTAHRGTCTVDGQQHCSAHLQPLRDGAGQTACERHRTTCVIDGVAFSLTGTRACPVCQERACQQHLAACRSCARTVCARDLEAGLCRTCGRLESVADPEDTLIAAALEANRGEPPKAKEWRVARDATHTVVELQLGWRRRLVVSVAHGESRPSAAMYHSLLGSERRR